MMILVALLLATQPPAGPETTVEHLLACKRAPLSFFNSQNWLLENGWTSTTPGSSGKPVDDGEARFTQGDVALTVAPHLEQRYSRCTSVATLPGTAAWPELQRQFTALIGREPESAAVGNGVWAVPDHRIEARLEGTRLTVTITPTGYSPFSSFRSAAVREGAPVAPSPAADIAAAAALCAVAAGDRAGALASAGWRADGGRFRREGSNVTILSAGPQCIVDAYGERADAFDQIREAVRDALVARFGRGNVRLSTAMGNARSFSRGQGFIIDGRIGVLSSEQRDDGLSIRFTVMSLR